MKMSTRSNYIHLKFVMVFKFKSHHSSLKLYATLNCESTSQLVLDGQTFPLLILISEPNLPIKFQYLVTKNLPLEKYS